jgi:mono/diheme cytochrome c family protein
MKTIVLICLVITSCVIFGRKQASDLYTPPAIQVNDTLYNKGESLFMQLCQACHDPGMKLRSTAPALGGVTKRFKKDWLYRFTRNSYQMYLDRDPTTVRLMKKNNMLVMSAFPDMKDNELDALYYFIEQRFKEAKKK